MQIYITNVFVDDQDKALKFYTEKLGFVTKVDVPVAGTDRWLTVVSPENPEGPQLLLEPDGHPAVGPYKEALFKDGIPAASFSVPNVHQEYERLVALGVNFTQPPQKSGPVTTAVFEDTTGNLIQLVSPPE